MNRKVVIIIGLQALLIVILFWVLVFYGKDEYEAYSQQNGEEVDTPNHVNTDEGTAVITISQQMQVQSDIQTTKLIAAKSNQTFSAYGKVLAIDNLIDLRTRYLAAKADATIISATLGNTKTEYERLRELNQDNRNVSDRAMLAAEAQYKMELAKLAAAETASRNLKDSIRQQWGDTLTKRATEQNNSQSLQQLLSYKQVLVQVTLPLSYPDPKPDSTLMIVPTGSQSNQIEATFVSIAPQTDTVIQGKTYFYRAPATNLRAGMRVTVSVREAVKASQGVSIPTSAILWYSGKPWVYKKEAEDKFRRVPVSTEVESSGGWFNISNLKPSDEIVVSGSQLLLSEEFKFQIKNENED